MGSKGVLTPERAEVSEPAHQAPASAFHTEFDCIPWQRCSPLSVVRVGLPLAHRLSRPFLHLLNFRSYIRHFLRSAPPAASDRVAWSVSVFSWSSHISKTGMFLRTTPGPTPYVSASHGERLSTGIEGPSDVRVRPGRSGLVTMNATELLPDLNEIPG